MKLLKVLLSLIVIIGLLVGCKEPPEPTPTSVPAAATVVLPTATPLSDTSYPAPPTFTPGPGTPYPVLPEPTSAPATPYPSG